MSRQLSSQDDNDNDLLILKDILLWLAAKAWMCVCGPTRFNVISTGYGRFFRPFLPSCLTTAHSWCPILVPSNHLTVVLNYTMMKENRKKGCMFKSSGIRTQILSSRDRWLIQLDTHSWVYLGNKNSHLISHFTPNYWQNLIF